VTISAELDDLGNFGASMDEMGILESNRVVNVE